MTKTSRIGPWLVALGAALWGTENAWRIPLGEIFKPSVLVWWEHVILVLLAVPVIIPRLGELKRVSPKTLAWLVFSGFAGSAVGTVFFTMALAAGNKTVANVVLNIQPVISTAGAVLFFHDRIARSFWPWAVLAIASGGVLATVFDKDSFTPALDAGVPYALLCAAFWGMSTVAGRGVMAEMSLPLAAGMRVVIGLVTMTIVVLVQGHAHAADLWPAAAGGETAVWLILLATVSGWVPLLVYFRGLSLTHASTAGYFEMMQTLCAVVITWGSFHAALRPYQVCAGLLLILAVAMVQRAQSTVGSA